jgi:uncharacterized protein (DUF362 family)
MPLPLLNVHRNPLVNFKTLQLLNDIPIPEITECLWNFPCPSLPDPEAELKAQLDKSSLARTIRPGSRIAITAGSRGISSIDTILARICEEVKKLHAHPVVVSAMGSHGGATEEGQREILKGYGITPERVGAPVLCSVTAVEVGKTADGMPVFIDDEAFQSDGIIVVNRVKSHTSFQGTTESGLLKMLVVGLGKHKGAQHIHQLGTRGLKTGIPRAAQVIMNRVPVLLGIGILENAQGDIAAIESLEPSEIEAGEARLLQQAKELMPAIPFKNIDVLVVQEMGKDVSGTGLDTNVIGRRMIAGEREPELPRISRIVVLDLSAKSRGNATGIGLADIITQRLYDKINFEKTLLNIISSTFIERAKIPLTLPTDKSAIQMGLMTCWKADPLTARIMMIKNTRSLQQFFISNSLLPEALKINGMQCSKLFSSLRLNRDEDLENYF